MIIDIHTHIGIVPGIYNMTKEQLIHSSKKYGVDYSLVSNIACGYDTDGLDGNKELIEFVKQNRENFGAMLWCTGRENEDLGEFEKLITENREVVKGLKIHPDISHIRADDGSFEPYYKLAEKYRLPILFHSKDSPFSKVEYIVNAAKRHPKIKMILGHLSLGDNFDAAFRAIANIHNIYGDTAWVRWDEIKDCPPAVLEKIMFGTDNPIAGDDTYAEKSFYPVYFNSAEIKKNGIMGENAKRILELK